MSWLVDLLLGLFSASAKKQAELEQRIEADKEASRRAIFEELEAAEEREKN